MLKIKEFTPKKVILTDGEKEYELKCTNESDTFDQDLLEDILYYRKEVKKDNEDV